MRAHRSSLYPLLIAGLTCGLVVLMAVTLPKSAPGSRQVVQPEVYTGPTEAEYESIASVITTTFDGSYSITASTEIRVKALEKVLHDLLALTVPPRYKDLHYGLVVSFTLMRDGLRQSDAAIFEKGWASYQAFTTAYPWLLN